MKITDNSAAIDGDYFTALIKVEKVVRPAAPTNVSYSRNDPPPHPGRVVTEVAVVSVRAKDLPGLLSKIDKHLSIVEDE